MAKRRKQGVWSRIVGEMSKLRTAIGVYLTGGTAYKLNSDKVTVTLARGLYNNTDENYKLGAAFAKPVINTTVGFMGVPQFRHTNPEAQDILDSFFGGNTSEMQDTELGALRDGDAYVWLTRESADSTDAALYPETPERLVYNIVPPDMVKRIVRNPVTQAMDQVILESVCEWVDENGNGKRATVTQTIVPGARTVVVNGDPIPNITSGTEVLPWSFIPIVHFKNEGDDSSEFGKSDLEAIEPFLKAYHDVLLSAIQGSRMHSTPKLKIKAKNVAQFLANNFGITDPVKFAQDGGTISLEGQELLILGAEEDADYVEVQSSTGDASTILKLLFYCIVDTSETPEFAFGVHMTSSMASTKEQMPILVRRIGRKREQFTKSWQRLARMVLAMEAAAGGMKFDTYETTLDWDEIDPRDDKDIADTLDKMVTAMANGVNGGLISAEAAVGFLAARIDTMNDYLSDDPEVPGERERILRTLLERAQIDSGALIDAELQAIKQTLEAGQANGNTEGAPTT